MPGVGGLPALDVAIGLIAVFFLLSTALSAINEGIASILGWRAKTLEDAIRNLLGDAKVKQSLRDLVLHDGWKRLGKITVQPNRPHRDDETAQLSVTRSAPTSATPPQSVAEPPTSGDMTTKLFNHWRIQALVREPDDPKHRRRRTRPSYLPPRAFSLALAETIADTPAPGAAEPGKSAWQLEDEDILRRVENAAEALPDGRLKMLVTKAAYNAGDTLEGFRGHVETAFDDAMERASGWYKRKVQIVLLVLAVVVTLSLDVDSVRIGNAFWNDQALRSAVIVQAQNDKSKDAVKSVENLDLPIGWGANAPDNVLTAIPGWILTIAALQLGAPFWFDLLSRLARLRGSGIPEQPRSLSDTAGTVDQSRTVRALRTAERVERQKQTAAALGTTSRRHGATRQPRGGDQPRGEAADH